MGSLPGTTCCLCVHMKSTNCSSWAYGTESEGRSEYKGLSGTRCRAVLRSDHPLCSLLDLPHDSRAASEREIPVCLFTRDSQSILTCIHKYVLTLAPQSHNFHTMAQSAHLVSRLPRRLPFFVFPRHELFINDN